MPSLKSIIPTDPKNISLTALIGIAGGLVFDFLNFPLAWMLGAMVATTVAAISGITIRGPGVLRNIMITVLGTMLGSTFTPEVLGHFDKWIGSLGVLSLYIITIVICTGIYLYRVIGYGAITSYFSAAPGGFGFMVIMGGEMGGNSRTIALIHSIRIMLTVLTIPFWFKFFNDYHPASAPGLGDLVDVSLYDGALLILCAISGYYLGKLIRLPSPQLLGPLLVSAAVHLSGFTEAKPPTEVMNLAQLIIGISVGARFNGIRLTEVLATIKVGAILAFYMVGLAAVFALVMEELTGLPFDAMLLAFAPGGLAEMAMVSLAMGIDTAFVSTHHMVRVLIMVSMAPIIFALIKKKFDITDDLPALKFRQTPTETDVHRPPQG